MGDFRHYASESQLYSSIPILNRTVENNLSAFFVEEAGSHISDFNNCVVGYSTN